jgi:hypothetical protein
MRFLFRKNIQNLADNELKTNVKYILKLAAGQQAHLL